MKKQWMKASFILVLLLTMSILAACGNSNNSNISSNKATNTSSSTTETSNTAEVQDDSNKYAGVVVSVEASQVGPLLIAKEKGFFEEEFGKYGATVEYQTLQSSSQFLEAIASDRLDFVRTGYIGTITGQAANIPFIAISEGSNGGGDGIIVPADSDIKSIEDLKGKKIGVSKGSSSWGLLLRALESVGLSSSDVQQVNLQPDEAQPAFLSGAIDAWAIWEPYRTSQISNGANLIAEVKTIGAFTPAFNIVRTTFAESYPELVVAYLQAYERALQWQNENVDEAVALLAEVKKLDESVIRISLENNIATNNPISDEAITSQQLTADILLGLGELKEKIDVSKVVDNSFINQALGK